MLKNKQKEIVGGSVPKTKLKDSINYRRRKELMFLTVLFIFPILHKIIFYIGGNLTSFTLAFQQYDMSTNSFVWADNIFQNFERFFSDIANSTIVQGAMLNTLYMYLIDTFLGIPIALLCSYFVVKKVPLAGALKVIFFLPSMVSGVVMVLMYKYFMDKALPAIATSLFGVAKMPDVIQEYPYAYWMMVIYTQWTGFAGGIVLYVGSMSKVGEGVTDAAQIDGVSVMGEFWHVTLPTVYPMLTVFLVTGLMAIFTGGGPVYTFHQFEAPTYCYTMGYYLYRMIMDTSTGVSYANYPYPAAVGIVVTIIGAPLTFLVKYLLERFGPSED